MALQGEGGEATNSRIIDAKTAFQVRGVVDRLGRTLLARMPPRMSAGLPPGQGRVVYFGTHPRGHDFWGDTSKWDGRFFSHAQTTFEQEEPDRHAIEVSRFPRWDRQRSTFPEGTELLIGFRVGGRLTPDQMQSRQAVFLAEDDVPQIHEQRQGSSPAEWRPMPLRAGRELLEDASMLRMRADRFIHTHPGSFLFPQGRGRPPDELWDRKF
jgi:hypothetical protein